MKQPFFHPLRRKTPATQSTIQRNTLTAVSRILYRLAAAAIICLCDQNPEFITPRATAHSLFGLAAGGVYHAVMLSQSPGGLLPHPFTLTALRRRSALCCTGLSVDYRPQHPSFQRGSPLCAVRTFLSGNISRRDCPRSRCVHYINITIQWSICKNFSANLHNIITLSLL